MIGLLFGEIKRLSILRRLVLVAGAIAIAMSANFLRAFFLVWIAASKGLVETGRWHDFAGYAIVALVFVGSLVLAAMLGGKKTQSSTGRKESRQQDSSASRISHRVQHSTFYVAAALVWILSVEVAAAGWYRAHEHGLVPTERWTVRWPQFEPGFREIQINPGVQETLRFDKGREVTWHDGQIAPGQPTSCLLFFFRWEPGTSTILRARAHRPDICLPSTGWRQVADHGIASYPAGTNFSLPFRHFTFVRETIDNQRPLFADAFFCLGEDAVRDGQTSGSALLEPNRPSSWEREARWRVVRDGIRNPGQQVMQFIIVSPRETSSSKVEQRFAEFLPRLVTRVRNGPTAEQRDR
jgi:exosortase/archaeosortase family protein